MLNNKKETILIVLCEMFRNINISILTPLITYIAINLLKENNAYIGVCNSILSIGYLLFSYTSGRLTDLYNKKMVILFSALTTFVALIVFYFSSEVTSDIKYIWLFVLLVFSFSNTSFDIALSGYVSDSFNSKNLMQINSLTITAFSIASIVGPIIFTYAILNHSFKVALLMILLLSLIVVVIVSLFNDHSHYKASKISKKASLIKSLTVIKSNRSLRNIVFSTVLTNLSFSILYTALPIYMVKSIFFSQSQVLSIWSFVGVGQLVGSILCVMINRKNDFNKSINLAILFSLPLLILMSKNVNYFVLALIIVSTNVSRSIGAIARKSIQQLVIDKKVIGTIMGTISTLTLGVNTVGYLIGGFLSDSIGFFLSEVISIVVLFIANTILVNLKNSKSII